MIVAFAAYLVLLSLLFGIAGLAAGPMLSRWGVKRRFIWAAALCASLVAPTAMSLSAASRMSQSAGIASVLAMLPKVTLPATARDHGELSAIPRAAVALPPDVPPAPLPLPRARSSTSVSLATIVRIGWSASCVSVWLFYALGMGRLLIATGRYPRVALFGTTVRLTDNMGPSVFGIWRPTVLWPRWLQSESPAIRRAALAHELEHLRCHDPLLLAVAVLLVSCAPWNPLLWWQLRRLRFAVEADCDRRVARRDAAAVGYAQVLWRIGRLSLGAKPTLAMPMSSPTRLERRIRLLLVVPARRRPWLSLASLCVTVVLLVAALSIRAPSLAATTSHAAKSANAALPVSVPTAAMKSRPPGSLHFLDSLGVVTATTVNVPALVDGQLTTIEAVEGKAVKAGQVLGTIDSPQLRSQLDRTLYQLSQDRARHVAAAISADEAAVAQTQRLIADAQVKAPIAGVVGLRKVDPGNFVHAGETLLVITQEHPIAVIFTIPEDVLPRVQALLRRRASPAVELFNRSDTGRLATGRLIAVDNQIDTDTGTIKLKALVDNEDGALFPNQFVLVRMQLTAP